MTATDVFELAPLEAPYCAEGGPDGALLGPDVEEWLGGLIYGVKRDYARAWALFLEGEGPEPADPGAAWAEKARRKLGVIVRRRSARCPLPVWACSREERACTLCGGTIGEGDTYRRSSTPAALSGTGRWETIVACLECCELRGVVTSA